MFIELNQTLSELYDGLIEGTEPDQKAADEVIAYLKTRKNIIYGAGRAGKMLYGAFQELGIPIERFIDRFHDQIGSVNGVSVDAPASLTARPPQADELLIIAAGTMQLAELIDEDIVKLGCTHPKANGLFLVYLLKYLVCKAHHAAGTPPELLECTSYHVKPYKCPIFCKKVEEMAYRDNPYQEVAGSSFNEFGYLLSEVCSLKCKHCLEAVPYLKNRETLPKETILKDIKKMVHACRFIHRLDLVGGEPFLHRELAGLVQDILRIERIGYIGVFTNGTVVPSDELCRVLKNDRIIVTVANYGESLSDQFRAKIAQTLKKLAEYGVQHFNYSDRYWFDINSFDLHEADDGRLEANYSNCFLAACRRMYNGTLYHCPYQCNGVKLGKFEKVDGQYVDIHGLSDAELARELDKFEKVEFIDACRYCSIPGGAKEVTAGEQL